MACDPATLIAAAKCWFSCGDRAQNDAIEIVFLCAIRDGDTSIVCDPATLQAQAQCILQCIPQGMMAAVKLGLLCSIAANGGGGGGGTTQVYIARDPLPPDDPTKPALNYPAGGGTLTQWDVGSAAWV